MILAASIFVGALALGIAYWVIFDGWDDFCECMGYALTPDVYSWLQGELGDDWWAEMKISLWILVAVAAGIGTHYALSAMLVG